MASNDNYVQGSTSHWVRPTCTCGPWWGVNPPPPCPVHTSVQCPYALRCPSCGNVGAHFCPGPPHVHAPRIYYYNVNAVSQDTATATG